MHKNSQDVIQMIKLARSHRASFNYKNFIRYVETNIDRIVKDFDTKWLISICDTIVDHDNERSTKAMIVVVFIKMLKFSSFRHEAIPPYFEMKKYWPEEIWDGVLAIDERADDFFHNMVNRIYKIIGDDELIKKIFTVILSRTINRSSGPIGIIFKHHIFIEQYKKMNFNLPDIHIRDV